VTATTSPAVNQGPSFEVPGFADVVRSEWHKFHTVRSTYWSLLTAVVVGLGLSALISLAASNHYSQLSESDRLKWDPTSVSTSGFGLAQLAIGVLGVLIITSEFSTGQIQMSLAAVPKRQRLLAAKGVVYAAVAFVVVEVLALVAFLVGQAIIHANAPSVTLGDHDVLRAVLGSGLYAAVLGLLALAIGTIVRSAAAGIGILVAFLYVLPAIAAALPSNLEHTVEKFWPTQAGGQLVSIYRPAHTLSPWAGFAWMAIFTAVIFAVAVVALRSRDV
jgi:ABC-type transport system involved in multi-copper enzyme maturation permease subunit